MCTRGGGNDGGWWCDRKCIHVKRQRKKKTFFFSSKSLILLRCVFHCFLFLVWMFFCEEFFFLCFFQLNNKSITVQISRIINVMWPCPYVGRSNYVGFVFTIHNFSSSILFHFVSFRLFSFAFLFTCDVSNSNQTKQQIINTAMTLFVLANEIDSKRVIICVCLLDALLLLLGLTNCWHKKKESNCVCVCFFA